MWDKYDEATMGIAVRHIRRYHYSQMGVQFIKAGFVSSTLPDYVFDKGERQPRSQKRPKTKVRSLHATSPLSETLCLISNIVCKALGKSNHTSPDVPHKKRRLVA